MKKVNQKEMQTVRSCTWAEPGVIFILAFFYFETKCENSAKKEKQDPIQEINAERSLRK